MSHVYIYASGRMKKYNNSELIVRSFRLLASPMSHLNQYKKFKK